MSRYTLAFDIAGRVARDIRGGARVTVGGIAVETDRVDALRAAAQGLPKWKDCTPEEAARAVEALRADADAVAVVSLVRDPGSWGRFWDEGAPLQAAIVKQDRKPAGFVKAANIAYFALFASGAAVLSAHCVKVAPRTGLQDASGLELFEHSVICDADIHGEENIALFCDSWIAYNDRQPLMKRMGLRFMTREVAIANEEDEPLLVLADYVAGLGHAAHIADPGRLRLPLDMQASGALLGRLGAKLVSVSDDFQLDYRDVFGDWLMDEAART